MESISEAPEIGPEVQMMSPDAIRFTQSKISLVFSTGKQQTTSSYSEALKASGHRSGHEKRTVHGLLDKLRKGELSVKDVPPIRVCVHDGVTYSLDNRRLWVFKHLGQPIPVIVEEDCEKEFFQKWDSNATGDLESVSFYDTGTDKFRQMSMLCWVLSWSLQNIQHKRLLVNKARPIRERFQSQSHYLNSFRWPLLEETRATIQQQLEGIEAAPRLQVTAREMCNRTDDQDSPQLKTFELESSGGTYKPRNKDLVLLATIEPQCLDDLRGAVYTFGFLRQVKNIGSSDDDFVMTALAYGPDHSPEYSALRDNQTTWTILHITNLATKLRIRETLDYLLSSEEQVPILQEVVGVVESEYPALFDQDTSFDEVELAVREYCEAARAMNPAQVEAVTYAVSGLVKKESPRIRLIQGPPGTGKTSLLITLLSILGSMNYRVHMAAPTNTAICEVASRFVSEQISVEPMSDRNRMQFGACFPAVLICGQENRILNLGDVVLIGSEEGIDLAANEVLESIYLPRRVKRLMEASSPFTGYKKSAQALERFLKSALAQDDSYTKCPETTDKSVKPQSLVTYVRENLKRLSHSVVTHARSICQDVPSTLLRPEARRSIYEASLLMTQIMEYLNSQDLSNEEMRLWVSSGLPECRPLPCESRKVLSIKHFVKVKSNCLQILAAREGYDVFGGKAPSQAELEDICLGNARILFSTVATGGRQCVGKSGAFDCVVIDEASQLVEAETLVITHSPRIQQVVLVGDHKQLAATVLSEVARDCQFGRSLFKRLLTLKHPCNMLDVQYRMHPDISFFPSNQFYDGHVKNGSNVLSEGYASKPFQQTALKTYCFLDVTDGTEQRDIRDRSYVNLVEVGIVMHLIHRLNKVCAETAVVLSVGVIAPYRGQVEELARRLNSRARNFPNVKAEVQSVDGFQGREKDVIIFSAVRSNFKGVIGFLSAPERLNVAITRARYCLWIVGNGNTLSADYVWRSLIEDSKQRRHFVQPDEAMVKVIKQVKSDMNKLEDLLKPTSCLFTNTLWQVLCSNELLKTVPKLKSKYARQLVIGAVLKLAEGRHATNWTYQRDFTGPHSKIAQVYPLGALYLVWSVDVQFAPEVKQVLKVWDAVEFGKVSALLARLDAAFSTYTISYVQMCNTRQSDRSKLIAPMRWEHDGGFVRFKALERAIMQCSSSEQESVLEKACVDESILVMKFYALNSGIAHQLITAADGSSFDLPFEVNADEARIILFDRSSFILGRSGTGKTTVVTTKLLRRQQHFRLAMHGIQEPAEETDREVLKTEPRSKDGFLRQALLTRSPKLCAAIKHHMDKMQRCLEAAESGATINNTEEPELKLHEDDENNLLGSIPNTFFDITAESFPLVITFSKLLNMIEGSVQNPFFSPEERAFREKPAFGSDNLVATALLNAKQADDSTRERGRIAAANMEDLPKNFEGSRLLKTKNRLRVEVDFSRFCAVYWSHFNKELTKGFDESLVFTEFMSSIKGSLAALRSPRRVMERSDYVALADQRSSMFAEEERERLYRLYLQYEKLKRMTYNDYDLADFVMHLHSELEHGAFQGQSLHYVYVDEVQDLTQAQIALLKYICPDHDNGFMFAGDTAQTIAKGVGFRFEDIRKLFYVEFLHRNLAGVEDALQPIKRKSKAVPDMHCLTQNFRTHTGIVKLANSVVQQIYHFFPYAIDRLEPETSLLQGEVPIFLEIQENHDLVTALFDRGDMGGGGCEFGAEQAIIVRDEHRKQATLKSLEAMEKTCLVLTVEECKGLEFQDVLMYNFFADSGLHTKWRVLYDILRDEDFEKNPVGSSKFQPHKHNVLCSELKQLYVAVTRARQRLLIYDDDVNSHRPILDYWRSRNLVQVQVLDESLVEKLKRKSSAQDWRRIGIELFDAKQFSNAKLCFQRAGNLRYAQLAEAEEHMQEAGKPGVSFETVTGHLSAARDIYLAVEKVDKAVMCCKHLRDYKQGGAILETNHRFEEAGDCFREGRHFFQAANAYHKGGCVKKCLDICWEAKNFDAGLSFVQEWKQASHAGNSQGTASSPERDMVAYLQKCADHFKEQNKVQEMLKYVKLFPSIDLQRIYLHDNLKELLELEEAAGNFKEAERIAEEIGAWERSATLSCKLGDTQGAIHKLLHLAQLELFWGGGNGKEHIQAAEKLMQAETSQASELELVILTTPRNPDADIGLLLDTWNKARLLQAPRLEIIAGHNALSHILNVMLGKSGCFTAKVTDQWSLPALGRDEAALEGAELLLLCKRLWVIWSKGLKCVLESLKSLADCKVNYRVADDPFLKACLDLLGVRQQAAGSFYLQYHKAGWLRGQYPSRRDITKKALTNLALEYWKEEVLQVSDKILSKTVKLIGQISNGGDMEGLLEMAVEMVEMGQVLETMAVRNKSNAYGQCSSEVHRLLSNYAGCRAPKSRRIITVLDSMAKEACHCERARVADVLTLYPFISQQCITEILGGEATNAAVLSTLSSWHYLFRCTGDEGPPISCHTLLGALEKLEDGILHQSVSSLEDIATVCCCMERAAVAVCSVTTHISGLIIPVRLAFSCMSGANQERFYSEAVRLECFFSSAVSPIIGLVAQKILFLLGTRKEQVSRLVVALVMILMNIPTQGTNIVQSLQTLFMQRYKLWRLPTPLEVELLNVFQRRRIKIAQLSKAFARAMAALDDPVIIITTGADDGPQWVTHSDITPVLLQSDSSGKPRFSLDGTRFDRGPSKHVSLLPQDVSESLEKGNLEGLVKILSRTKPPESAAPPVHQAASESASVEAGIVGSEIGQNQDIEEDQVGTSQSKQQGCQGPPSQQPSSKKKNNRKNRRKVNKEEQAVPSTSQIQISGNQGQKNKKNKTNKKKKKGKK